MRVKTILIGLNNEIGNIRFSRTNAIALITASLIAFSFTSKAKVFTANLDGQYNDQNIWVPSYPGNIINETDTVYIANDVKLSTNIVVKGTLMVRMTGSLMGNKDLVVLPEGKLLNFGITMIDAMNNRGMVYNKHIMEIGQDIINSGEVVNQESMVVGNIVENTGLITGNGGSLIANKKFVNSQTGMLKGSIDVCSNNFMNVDGGSVDSARLSFCGQRIFSNVYLSADIRKNNIVLSLRNDQSKDYKKFQVERSLDGINYELVATVAKDKLNDLPLPFRYVDDEVVKSNSVFYRMKIIHGDDSETFIPAIEVGNIPPTD